MKHYLIFFFLVFICSVQYTEENPGSTREQEWKAIIAYFPGTPEEVTEDWVFFLFDVEEHFKADEHIYFIGIFTCDDAVVPIVGREDELIANIDISAYIGKTAGYIFVMKGKDPLWCDHMPSDKVIQEAERYFYGPRGED